MLLSLFLSVFIPQLIGFILILAAWPTVKPVRANLILKSCLSVGCGFGILSCLYFLQLSFFGPSRKVLAAGQVVFLICASAVLFYRLKSNRDDQPVATLSNGRPQKRLRLILSVSIITAIVLGAVAVVFLSLNNPHGEWDAWAVYNMKARFLFRAGDYWRDLFYEPTGWTSPDYPLLIPAAIAACWTIIGRDTVAIPIIVGFLFTFATIGVVYCSVTVMRGKSQGLLAGLMLACTPFFIMHGANQYTDGPLAFFFLATIALLHLPDSLPTDEAHRDKSKYLILAGVMIGMSTWTKNEGLLFLVAIFAARIVVFTYKKRFRRFLNQTISILTGLIPILLVVIYFKMTLATPNRMLFPPQGPTLIQKVLEGSRYWITFEAFVNESLRFGRWSASLTAVLVGYLLLVGAAIKGIEVTSIVSSFITIAIMVAGFFAALVLSPLDVQGHISSSLNRVLLEIWPSVIFLLFLVVRTPEQALMRHEVSTISP